MKILHLWVVEHLASEPSSWRPTVGVGLDKASGHQRLTEWKERNPDDQFRLALYEMKEVAK